MLHDDNQCRYYLCGVENRYFGLCDSARRQLAAGAFGDDEMESQAGRQRGMLESTANIYVGMGGFQVVRADNERQADLRLSDVQDSLRELEMVRG